MPQETSINAAAIAALEHIETTLKATMNQLMKALENLPAKSPEVELALEIDRFVGLRKTILAEIQRSRQQLQGQTTTQNEEALNILKELDSQVNAERWKAFVLHWHILQGPQTFALHKAACYHNSQITDLHAPLLPLGTKDVPHPPNFPATAQDLKEMLGEDVKRWILFFKFHYIGKPSESMDKLNLCLFIGVVKMIGKIVG